LHTRPGSQFQNRFALVHPIITAIVVPVITPYTDFLYVKEGRRLTERAVGGW
jgi:hypothetical protein